MTNPAKVEPPVTAPLNDAPAAKPVKPAHSKPTVKKVAAAKKSTVKRATRPRKTKTVTGIAGKAKMTLLEPTSKAKLSSGAGTKPLYQPIPASPSNDPIQEAYDYAVSEIKRLTSIKAQLGPLVGKRKR